MRIIVILIFIGFSIIAITAKSQSYVSSELYGYYNHSKQIKPLCSVYLKSNIKNKTSFVSYYMLTKTWAEGLIGLNWKLTPWLNAELMFGAETQPDMWRISPCFYIKKGKLNYMGVFEYGASGFWYLSYMTYKIKPHSTIGILANRSLGFGLRYDFTPKKSPISIWTAPIKEWNNDNYGFILGLSILI